MYHDTTLVRVRVFTHDILRWTLTPPMNERRSASTVSTDESMSNAEGVASLECITMSELESMVPELNTFSSIEAMLQRGENAWVCFESDVRAAAASALDRLRAHGGECADLLRLCEFEEQTRCQAFQATMMGEVGPSVYQATVRSILEKLLGKLETLAPEPSLYQAAAQCLSEYMSALNHHCDICAVPPRSSVLPAIAEDYLDSSDYPSEFGSEDAETLSVHSEATEGAVGRRFSGSVEPVAPAAPTASNMVRLTDAERKERRRDNNRKASVKYRSRKALSMQQVVAELAAARQQVTALTSQNAVLSAENSLLKQQVAFFQSVMQPSANATSSACGLPATAPAPTVPSFVPPPSTSLLSSTVHGANAAPPVTSAAGMVAPVTAAPPLAASAASAPSHMVAFNFPGIQPQPHQRPQRSVPPSTTAASPAERHFGTQQVPKFVMQPKPSPRLIPPMGGDAGAMTAGAALAPPTSPNPIIEREHSAMEGPADAAQSKASVCMQPPPTADCGVGLGVSEWLTADAHLRL